jgi:hypothetical protein
MNLNDLGNRLMLQRINTTVRYVKAMFRITQNIAANAIDALTGLIIIVNG